MRSRIDTKTAPLPLAPQGRAAIRPSVRRWARSLSKALIPLIGPPPSPSPQRRLLVLFLDGIGESTLRRAAAEGLTPFLATMRDGRTHRESRAFSGMPSTTTAFQAGLFFGLRHPDIPAFNWRDRGAGRTVRMNAPEDAARMEAQLRSSAGAGLFTGGTSYLSILAGGSPGGLSTAGFGDLRRRLEALGAQAPPNPLSREDGAPRAAPEELPSGLAVPGSLRALRAKIVVHAQTAASLAFRLGTETPGFLARMASFCPSLGSSRHELGFLLNHLGVGTIVSEVAKSAAILDLMRGVPRIFLCLHDFDEHAHRRGPSNATRILPRLDRAVEAMVAIAEEAPNPPDIWILSDHGHIPAVPFERIFGCTLAEWLAGGTDGWSPPLPEELARPQAGASPLEPPLVIDGGNYAHIYLGGSEPWDLERIASRHGLLLARALGCPGVGLVVMRAQGGAVAYSGSRRIDPADAGTLPRGVSPQAARALLIEMERSPSAGDLLLYGSRFGDASIAFSWELSSHGGPSREETETFVLSPVGLEAPPIAHGADLHHLFRRLYVPRDPAGPHEDPAPRR